ncbi:hypothetical protein LX36DRAFT_80606 [Colletotrichum falcatum]|nr:hypothetical protein LX36DRAFT_80606 [Colletotrichum falcatum]
MALALALALAFEARSSLSFSLAGLSLSQATFVRFLLQLGWVEIRATACLTPECRGVALGFVRDIRQARQMKSRATRLRNDVPSDPADDGGIVNW